MNLLITGGAGYIGSHMVRHLLEHGHAATTFDNLSSGEREAIAGGRFVEGDLSDRGLLDSVLAAGNFDGVMHFAGFIQVGESVRNPAMYYRNNLVYTLTLLDAMVEHGVDKLVFSSSAAVYGNPRYVPIDEQHDKQPLNPYGASKLMVEQILQHYCRAYGLASASLRYFNAAGAHPDGSLGERHSPETHLIPLALQAITARQPTLKVFGHDYDTPDGTCIRDYVHVVDLCDAHLLAMQQLLHDRAATAYNLGNGSGYSVQQVLNAVRDVTGHPVPTEPAPRREGDPAVLVADATLARNRLGWSPRYGDLHTIIEHAWAWEQTARAPSS
jgi:UDP-glucose 4-epimerase